MPCNAQPPLQTRPEPAGLTAPSPRVWSGRFWVFAPISGAQAGAGKGWAIPCRAGLLRAGWAQTRHTAGWPRSASRWNVGLIEHQEGLGLCGEPCVCLCVLRAPLPSGNRCQMERGAGDARAAAAQPGAHRRFRLRNVLCEPLFPSGGSSHTGCVAGAGK